MPTTVTGGRRNPAICVIFQRPPSFSFTTSTSTDQCMCGKITWIQSVGIFSTTLLTAISYRHHTDRCTAYQPPSLHISLSHAQPRYTATIDDEHFILLVLRTRRLARCFGDCSYTCFSSSHSVKLRMQLVCSNQCLMRH